MRWFLTHLGTRAGLILPKAALFLIFALALYLIHWEWNWALVAALDILYAGVLLHNIKEVKKNP